MEAVPPNMEKTAIPEPGPSDSALRFGREHITAKHPGTLYLQREEKIMKKRIALLLAMLTLLTLATPVLAEAVDGGEGHEHRWVASAITRIRTCRLCGEQLRDIVDEHPLVYSVPTDWVRYQPTGGTSTLWFPHGHADDGTVSIYRTKMKKGKKVSLESLAKERIGKGSITASEKTSVAGREAFLAEYRTGDEVGCVISFYDAASGYAVDWKVSSNERRYAILREAVDGLLETVRFSSDPEPEMEQNPEIPSRDLTLVEELFFVDNTNYPDAIVVMRNDSNETADLCAVIKGTNAAGAVVDTKSAFAYSVAPGEEVVVSQIFNSKAKGFRTELYAEPSVYYEAMGNNPGFKVRLTRDGRKTLISAVNNTELTAFSISAQLLYFNKGELVEFDTQTLVSGNAPLVPGKTASGTSFCFEEYDDVQCYITAYGKAVTKEPTQGQVEVLAEYLMVRGSYTDRYLVLKNNASEACIVNTSTTAIGADGKALDHAINYGVAVAPGCTALSFEYFNAVKVDHFDTQMTVRDATYRNVLSPDSFKVTGRRRNIISGTRVRGELTVTVANLGRETAEGAGIRVLFFKKGELVACEDADLTDRDNPMAPGKTVTVKVTPDAEYDRYEIYLQAYGL